MQHMLSLIEYEALRVEAIFKIKTDYLFSIVKNIVSLILDPSFQWYLQFFVIFIEVVIIVNYDEDIIENKNFRDLMITC